MHNSARLCHDGRIPIILIGAFDRHNFGDLLFAHIATALLPGEQMVYAGLAQRDMRPYGGHQVEAVRQLAEHMQMPVRILHVGGELLSCSAWEAAAMLRSSDEAQAAPSSGNVGTQRESATEVLGVPDRAPYTVARGMFAHAAAIVYNAVGGVDLAAQDPALRAEVVSKLIQADYVAVRDWRTLAALQAEAVMAHLLPDSAVMVAELFAETIERHARKGEPAQVKASFPHSYLAVQFSADFGQAAILDCMAVQLQRIAAAHHCGIVLFRAGAAPLHDELAAYRRLAERLRNVPLHRFQSLNIWDICALIAHSRGYLGSSLHGRILALAFARPRLTLRHPDQPRALPTKHEAFVQTWEDCRLPGVVALDHLADEIGAALDTDPSVLRDKAMEISAIYRQGFNALRTRFLSIN